jgi:hypothetical protein
MDTVYYALTGLNAIIGLFSSLAVNMLDFGRFSKNRLAGPPQFLALIIIGALGTLTLFAEGMTPFACVWNGARLVQFDRLAVGHDVYNATADVRYLPRIEMKIKSFMDHCKVLTWVSLQPVGRFLVAVIVGRIVQSPKMVFFCRNDLISQDGIHVLQTRY